jgi:hypothetical protein
MQVCINIYIIFNQGNVLCKMYVIQMHLLDYIRLIQVRLTFLVIKRLVQRNMPHELTLKMYYSFPK